MHKSEESGIENEEEEEEEEERKTFWLSGDFLVWNFRDAFSRNLACCRS